MPHWGPITATYDKRVTPKRGLAGAKKALERAVKDAGLEEREEKHALVVAGAAAALLETLVAVGSFDGSAAITFAGHSGDKDAGTRPTVHLTVVEGPVE